MKLIIIMVCALLLISTVENYKILVLTPWICKSHWMFFEQFVETLLQRGHEITCITSHKYTGHPSNNYTEIRIDPPLTLDQAFKHLQVYEMDDTTSLDTVKLYPHIGKISSEYAFSHSKVKEFIHRNDLHFDLVINQELYHDSWLMFGYKFKAPVVTICPTGTFDFFDRNMGLLTPYAHVSHNLLTYTDDMLFLERLHNTMVSLYEWIYRRWVHIPTQDEIAKRFFSHLGPLPSVDELVRNVSVILTNSHPALFHPRPAMPTLINIGGAHLKKTNPLPNDLQTFLDEAEHGVILFNLGTVIKSSGMPIEKLNAFLDAFKQLKQKVLWKYEDESLTNIPSNVLIQKWLPQNDILAHPNVKLFISHGGMFSNFESAAHGVPMIMIPFMMDQYRNAIKVEKAGYGKFMRFKDITTDSLSAVLKEMLTEKRYLKKAKEISAIFNDNIIPPMDLAMWWIEFVARHNGATHLKSSAVNMNWFSYLLLDIFSVIIICVLVPYILYFFAIKNLSLLFFKHIQNVQKSNKKKIKST